MSKSKAAVTGTLRITTQGQLLSIQGTLVEQTAEYVTLDVKRRGSKKTDRATYAAADIKLAFVSDEQNETYLSVIGASVDDYVVELQEIAGGYFSGTMGESAVLAAPGTWTFLPDVVEGEETAPTPAKAPAKAATAPAKGKAKAAVEEEEEQEEEEEEETPAYEPEKGDYVKVVDADEEETEGVVELINAKAIKVGGVKFNRADVTVTAAEAPVEEEEEEQEEGEAYEPADGDYVSVTDADDEVVTGTITGLTAKKVTITDAEDEEHGFLLSKVTVALSEKPKAKAAAKAGAKAADKPAGKAAAAPKGKAAAEDDNW